MKKTLNILGLVLFVSILSSFQINPQTEHLDKDIRGRWVKIGKRTVSKGADHDVMFVSARKGSFKKLKFKITKSPVYIKNIRIVYANGSSENIIINRNIRAGESSPVFDLKGNRRIIKKIIFNYHTKFFALGKGKIHVFGKH